MRERGREEGRRVGDEKRGRENQRGVKGREKDGKSETERDRQRQGMEKRGGERRD